ncbi:hypothetical protein KUV26_15380 [Leisingera daeponensis]|uniref:Uncharacterized protein n=1 Tax=Leisingera daeponensis TaxID=405746 RepID=A0ABS7NHZ0_9RHOB|nr:hypothetical protein [Leisingera daeponensis]MBY6058466.1 hypothetical protein [Leisingera daeponensis]MBY6140821.1 hypothetical protein [Leisingera daeponensis]
MLTDIYARSMMTAARQDCVRLRDLTPAKPLPRGAGLLARLAAWLQRRPVKTRCVRPQNI